VIDSCPLDAATLGLRPSITRSLSTASAGLDSDAGRTTVPRKNVRFRGSAFGF
jgi:hypothetical protein